MKSNIFQISSCHEIFTKEMLISKISAQIPEAKGLTFIFLKSQHINQQNYEFLSRIFYSSINQISTLISKVSDFNDAILLIHNSQSAVVVVNIDLAD
jgi:hypothetical protein